MNQNQAHGSPVDPISGGGKSFGNRLGGSLGIENGSTKKPRLAKNAAKMAALARFDKYQTQTVKQQSQSPVIELDQKEIPRRIRKRKLSVKQSPVVDLVGNSKREVSVKQSLVVDLVGNSKRKVSVKQSPVVDLVRKCKLPMKQSPVVELLEDTNDENKDDSKLPTNAVAVSSRSYDYQPGYLCLMKSSGEGPFQIIRVHITGHFTIWHPQNGDTKLRA